MDPLYLLDRSLVLSHVAAGMAALGSGVGAMLTRKGGPAHRLWGKIFFWGMAWVLVSTVALMFFRFNFFLLIIAVLSFYSALTGYRVLFRKRQDQIPANWMDWFSSLIALASGAGLAGWGALGLLGLFQFPPSFFVLGLVFGGGLLANSVSDVRDYLNPPTERNAWWYKHMGNMSGAYLAAVTAFIVQNIGRHLPGEWQWVTWVLPALVGVPLINYWVAHYKRKFTGHVASAAAVVGTD